MRRGLMVAFGLVMLGCSGLMARGQAIEYARMSLRAEILTPASERDALQELLRTAFDRAEEEALSLRNDIDFEDAFELAIADGKLEPAEMKSLTVLVDSWPGERSPNFAANMVIMDTERQQLRDEGDY